MTSHKLSTILLLILISSARCGEQSPQTQAEAEEPVDSGQAKANLAKLEKELGRLSPRGFYVVINTAANRLYLFKNGELQMEAVCSTGSGQTLISGDRSWTFETPRGEFSIRSKTANPVWRKPDWAFLEEGEAIPADDGERLEYGVLGEYALGIGNGYFIHGTLYTRMLGKNVTHGCVRLDSKELIQLAKTVPIGTKVYIF
ncbi:MAG: L,D-transpeptidase [Acidobacteriota bacterium]|nr:MAG: L,D-transpeptidase [Acidobacteriota bacterium]